MYVRKARIEDMPLMIRLMRDVLYPYLDRKREAYNPVLMEKSMRDVFHKEQFAIALHNGKCVGFIWYLEEKGKSNKQSLKVRMLVLEIFSDWDVAMRTLIDNASDYALSKGLEQIQLLRLRNEPSNRTYCSPEDIEGVCKTGPGK